MLPYVLRMHLVVRNTGGTCWDIMSDWVDKEM